MPKIPQSTAYQKSTPRDFQPCHSTNMQICDSDIRRRIDFDLSATKEIQGVIGTSELAMTSSTWILSPTPSQSEFLDQLFQAITILDGSLLFHPVTRKTY
ncbi:hypothetical protein Moror_7527 [Moniliophthora roreri MCA 2997]|uniref:Uncharacterized protein n=1 Tax=Moniliophthora roreri (strain MCA 2997) TaxID=1381753 RepID=V2WQS8_MONRO|nr:hypothetical protein Moror_7527 [Moniliophthora roreri MCA 2997]